MLHFGNQHLGSLAKWQIVDLTPAFLEALGRLLVGSPRVAVSCSLIVCERHLDLVIELDVASGNLVIYLLQFLEKPAIGRGLVGFGFQPSDS